jgi:hypothetical protein
MLMDLPSPAGCARCSKPNDSSKFASLERVASPGHHCPRRMQGHDCDDASQPQAQETQKARHLPGFEVDCGAQLVQRTTRSYSGAAEKSPGRDRGSGALMRVVGAMMTSMSGGVGSLPDSMARKCLAHSKATPPSASAMTPRRRINQPAGLRGPASGWRA